MVGREAGAGREMCCYGMNWKFCPKRLMYGRLSSHCSSLENRGLGRLQGHRGYDFIERLAH